MKKTLWTLNVDGYAPEITAITYPFLRAYADRIGAEFRVISERKSPSFPAVYEKLQIFELGKDSDWNIFIDSDALVHPNMMDVTEIVQRDTVVHNGVDYAANRYTYDEYFRRDGRHISSANWFTVASNWCLDLWHPLEDLTLEQAVERIHPILVEKQAAVDRSHLIDDFVLSRNIARYGLKCTTVRKLLSAIGQVDDYHIWHQYLCSTEQKVTMMKQILKMWELSNED